MNNLDMMRKRFQYQGGIHQEDRMIRDKQRSLHKALLYSYQACSIELVQQYSAVLEEQDDPISVAGEVRALINPDKVKQDYDDKIVSLDYEHGYQSGDVFEWKKTDSFWIIYTQELTEDAYFRGEIRRCRYKIKFKDEAGKECSTWAAIRGPVETQITSIQKNQERIDRPNLSLNILMPRNEKTLQAFERYKEFLFAGRCWRVEATDSISMKNILEINAEEDYINTTTDDVDREIKEGLIIEKPEPVETEIKGESSILPKIAETYSIDEEGGTWSIVGNAPVVLKIGKRDPQTKAWSTNNQFATVTWNKAVSGQFVLQWVKGSIKYEKTIMVESLY